MQNRRAPARLSEGLSIDSAALAERLLSDEVFDFLPPARPQIARVRYTHEAMIDLLIENPAISQNELALRFGYSASWISTIMASDAFQARLAERREAIVDPALRANVKTQLEGLTLRSMEILRAKLAGPPETVSDQTALRTLEVSARAAGYGARTPQVAVQVNIGERLETLGDNITRLLHSKRADGLLGRGHPASQAGDSPSGYSPPPAGHPPEEASSGTQ